MTGQGGWPMTVLMTAAGEPFYCGTYFPPAPRHGMPSFQQLLSAITDAWTTRRDELAEAADGIRELPPDSTAWLRPSQRATEHQATEIRHQRKARR